MYSPLTKLYLMFKKKNINKSKKSHSIAEVAICMLNVSTIALQLGPNTQNKLIRQRAAIKTSVEI